MVLSLAAPYRRDVFLCDVHIGVLRGPLSYISVLVPEMFWFMIHSFKAV